MPQLVSPKKEAGAEEKAKEKRVFSVEETANLKAPGGWKPAATKKAYFTALCQNWWWDGGRHCQR